MLWVANENHNSKHWSKELDVIRMHVYTYHHPTPPFPLSLQLTLATYIIVGSKRKVSINLGVYAHWAKHLLHQVNTIIVTYKNVWLPGHSHLLTTDYTTPEHQQLDISTLSSLYAKFYVQCSRTFIASHIICFSSTLSLAHWGDFEREC